MSTNAKRFFVPLVGLLLAAAVASAQQTDKAVPPPGKIYLDVVVTPKSGPPVSGLQQQDFTLIDNKSPRPLASFQALGGNDAPIEVILLIDAVNIGYDQMSYARDEIEKFLSANGGHLAYPTALAIFTDTGTQIQEQFSNDGKALSASLDQYVIGLRSIRRSAGFYGAAERFGLSLQTMHELAVGEAARPGRKLILWVSPGWPVLSGPGVLIDSNQQQRLFSDILSLSQLFEQGRITLYSIDPLGTADFGGRALYWQAFTKPVTKPSQVQAGNLALEVLATQSGGLALNTNNDVASLLQKCLADASAYYELSFDPPLSDQPHEYHHLEVKVDKPGVTARTKQGYYSRP
jgi:VWFA-related protein